MLKHLCLVAAVAVLTATSARAEDVKVDKTSLVGVWTAQKGSETLPPGATLEFTKDGKIKITVKQGEKAQVVEGTYTIDGSKLKTVLKAGDKEHAETITITKLTKKELVIVDEMKKKDVLSRK